jgi:hypothetical protein
VTSVTGTTHAFASASARTKRPRRHPRVPGRAA